MPGILPKSLRASRLCVGAVAQEKGGRKGRGEQADVDESNLFRASKVTVDRWTSTDKNKQNGLIMGTLSSELFFTNCRHE